MRRPTPLLLAALLLAAVPVAGQVRTSPGDSAVSEHSRSIGETGVPVSAGSRPMRDGSRPIGESSWAVVDGRARFGSVRDLSSRSMLSGPVSSLSRGPMTQPRVGAQGGSMTAASSGAVKHDRDRPLGTRISQPLRELGALQEQLRALRQHGDAAAIAAAAAPVGAPLTVREPLAPAAHGWPEAAPDEAVAGETSADDAGPAELVDVAGEGPR